jgi:hypothetical protein
MPWLIYDAVPAIRVQQCDALSQWPCSLGVAVRPLACWDSGFEFRGAYGCLAVVSVVCCQVEFCASGWSFAQRSRTECVVSECDLEASIMRRRWPTRGCCVMKKRSNSNFLISPGIIQKLGLDTSNLETTRLKAYEVAVRLRNALLVDTLYAIWGVGLIRSEIKIPMSPIARVCTWNSINYVWAVPSITR